MWNLSHILKIVHVLLDCYAKIEENRENERQIDVNRHRFLETTLALQFGRAWRPPPDY